MEEGETGGVSCDSLSSCFKTKVLVSESSSCNQDTLYVDDGGIPFGKTARYNDREDRKMVQEMYGLTTYEEFVDLFESTRNKHDDIVSPNIRFTYGVKPYTRDSDPRIGNMAIQKEQLLHMVRTSDRIGILPKMRRRSEVSKTHRMHSGMPDFKEKPPVGKCNQEEIWRKRYEKWEEQEQELLHARDLRMATRGLVCFNLKFKTDYMVEEVLGSQKIHIGRGVFFHCNFIARSKKGSKQRLFFAEAQNAFAVTLCCILDDGVRGCRFCGDEFVHPSEEGLLRA